MDETGQIKDIVKVATPEHRICNDKYQLLQMAPRDVQLKLILLSTDVNARCDKLAKIMTAALFQF